MELKGLVRRLIDMLVGCIIGVGLALDIGWAGRIDPSKAGVSLWIFLAVGIFIVLLQLIPVFILATSLIWVHFVEKKKD